MWRGQDLGDRWHPGDSAKSGDERGDQSEVRGVLLGSQSEWGHIETALERLRNAAGRKEGHLGAVFSTDLVGRENEQRSRLRRRGEA